MGRVSTDRARSSIKSKSLFQPSIAGVVEVVVGAADVVEDGGWVGVLGAVVEEEGGRSVAVVDCDVGLGATVVEPILTKLTTPGRFPSLTIERA